MCFAAFTVLIFVNVSANTNVQFGHVSSLCTDVNKYTFYLNYVCKCENVNCEYLPM